MKVVVIGLGYIGLPTALMFAKHEVNVVGVDISTRVVNSLNSGIAPIKEPGITEYLKEALTKKTFKASFVPEKGDVFIVAVPTPNNDDKNKSCDLSYIRTAIESILPHLDKGNTVIIESTVSPNTVENVIKPIFDKAGFTIGQDLYLVHCPERVLPGKIFNELVNNNRVIGGVTKNCTKKGLEVYGIFVKGELLTADASTAEMAKLMENTYRDVNIALANELVKICSSLSIDALNVIELANMHPRVNIHQPGPGVGGHCLAVDPYFIVSEAPKEAKLIAKSREVNRMMPNFIVKKTIELMKQHSCQKISILGVAYKGNIDDCRESPALEIISALQSIETIDVKVFDPYFQSKYEKDLTSSLKDSEFILVLCDHEEFQNFSMDALNVLNKKILFDTKNIVKDVKNFDYSYTLGNIS